MKFGLRYCNAGENAEAEAAIELVQAAEEAGFESCWASDHPILPIAHDSKYPYNKDGKLPSWGEYVMPDPLIWIANVAAHTSSIKFGTAVMILPLRNPVILAKQVASLDRLAKGRFILGIGVGWMKEEFDALNADFSNRGRAADEYVKVMRTIWTEREPSFQGEFVKFGPGLSAPKPISAPLPIIVGGDSKPAARRAGRLADGYMPVGKEPWELIDLARDTAEKNGRDGNAIEITMPLPDKLDDIPKLAARGVNRLLVPLRDAGGVTARVAGAEGVRKFADVISEFGDA